MLWVPLPPTHPRDQGLEQAERSDMGNFPEVGEYLAAYKVLLWEGATDFARARRRHEQNFFFSGR